MFEILLYGKLHIQTLTVSEMTFEVVQGHLKYRCSIKISRKLANRQIAWTFPLAFCSNYPSLHFHFHFYLIFLIFEICACDMRRTAAARSRSSGSIVDFLRRGRTSECLRFRGKTASREDVLHTFTQVSANNGVLHVLRATYELGRYSWSSRPLSYHRTQTVCHRHGR